MILQIINETTSEIIKMKILNKYHQIWLFSQYSIRLEIINIKLAIPVAKLNGNTSHQTNLHNFNIKRIKKLNNNPLDK